MKKPFFSVFLATLGLGGILLTGCGKSQDSTTAPDTSTASKPPAPDQKPPAERPAGLPASK